MKRRRRYNTYPTPTDRPETKHGIIKLNSLAEFVAMSRAGFHEIHETSWAGVKTNEEACTLAEQGWAEGVEKVSPLLSRLISKVTSLIEVPQIAYDVTGLDFDMGLVMEGVPESWYRFEHETRDGAGFKHVRVVMNFAVSGGISANIIEARGAIVCALVVALEASGIRVTVDAVCAVDKGRKELWVNLKQADQPLDLDRMVFAMVHPAFLRHLLLASTVWHSYAPGEVSAESQGDIYIGKAHLIESQWANPEHAQAWIVEQLRAQGVHIQ